MYKIILYPLSFFSVLYLIFLYNWHYNYDLFYYMPTKSMMPTLQVGDQFFVRVNYYKDNPVKSAALELNGVERTPFYEGNYYNYITSYELSVSANYYVI